MLIPSKYPHPLYRVTKWLDDYGVTQQDRKPAGTTDAPEDGVDVVSSAIVGTSSHTVMLDLDIPATLLPSSTPGHHHLYVDHAMSWRRYKRLLRALWKAGLIERGYYRASVQRRGTHLRVPGVTKESNAC